MTKEQLTNVSKNNLLMVLFSNGVHVNLGIHLCII